MLYSCFCVHSCEEFLTHLGIKHSEIKINLKFCLMWNHVIWEISRKHKILKTSSKLKATAIHFLLQLHSGDSNTNYSFTRRRSAASQPKRTHFGAACNETTQGALSASTSTAFSPTRHRHSQPPSPPYARGPNCIEHPKTPSEAAHRVGNTSCFSSLTPL